MGATNPPFRPKTQAHLERTYYEICTSLTCLRSNVALLERAGTAPAEARERIFQEVDEAMERLRALSHEVRAWHAENAVQLRTTTVESP